MSNDDAASRSGDQPWARMPDRRVWRAYRNGLVLTVSRLTVDGWLANVDGEGIADRSPQFTTRLAAQRWAEDRAAGAR